MNGKEYLVRQQALQDAAVRLAWCPKADYADALFQLTERALEFGGMLPCPFKGAEHHG